METPATELQRSAHRGAFWHFCVAFPGIAAIRPHILFWRSEFALYVRASKVYCRAPVCVRERE